MTRDFLFSVTAKECRFDYYRGSGKGGQKRNKTSNAVRCTHEPSGAVGRAEDTRSQRQNKELAFVRMVKGEKFQSWLRRETARHLGQLAEIEEEVDRQMKNVVVEFREDGRWFNANADDTEVTGP